MSNTQQFRRKHATSRTRKPRLDIYAEVKEVLHEQRKTMKWLYTEMGVSRQFLTCTLNGTYPWPEDRIAQLNAILGTDFSVPDELLSA